MSWPVVAMVMKTKVGSSAAKAVLLALANHCDDAGKSCFPGQETIQRITELSADTIQRQIKFLIDAGYITGSKERKKGRWASWNYQINLSVLGDGQAASCGTVDENQAAPCGTAKPHHAARPYRTMRHKPSTKPINQPSRAKPSSPDGLGDLGARLRDRIGPDKLHSWFRTATIAHVAPDSVTLELETRFLSDYVNINFMDDLTACCKAVYPTIERVRVIAA